MVLQNDILLYYKSRLEQIIEDKQAADVIPPSLFIDSFAVWQSLINKLAGRQRRYFANFQAKATFVLNDINFPEEGHRKAELAYSFYISVRLSESEVFISGDDVDFILTMVIEVINHFVSADKLEFLKVNSNAKLSSFSRANLTVTNEIKELSLRVISREKTETGADEFLCYTINEEEVIVRFFDVWVEVAGMLWKNAKINVFNVFYKIGEKKYITVNASSLVVVEPDYMVDATDIAECFQNNGFNIYIHFLKRLTIGGLSQSLIVGSIVNSIFDDLLSGDNLNFGEIFSNAIKTRLLSCFALALKDSTIISKIREKAIIHFENIQKVMPDLRDGIISIEPAYISPIYGIKGRLDLLQEYEESSKKNIIELKSGKPPSLNYFYKKSGTSVRTGLWSNNLAQTTCYNLLLDSAYKERSGNSMIFYSATDANSMRNAPVIEKNKQEVLLVRNWITAIERNIAIGNYSILSSLHPEKIGLIPSFMSEEITKFQQNLSKLDELEYDYYTENLAFIYREMFAHNIGVFSERTECSASQSWDISIAGNSSNRLLDLEIDEEKSDFKAGYIHLKILNEQDNSIRCGDAMILYPHKAGLKIYQNQILKCAVKDISVNHVLLTLRNKMLNIGFFKNYELWNIINDNSDNNQKKNISSLFRFIDTDKSQRDLLLGRREPEFMVSDYEPYSELSEQQNELLEKAVTADDYFILQGPPGTGKTSYMLKYMVRYLYEKTDDTILLTAYTNQAVDEICEAISTISNDIDFIRLGSKESSRHKKNLLSELGATEETNTLYKRVKKCRIFCATTSFAVNNPEIFSLKNFNTMIVDEAAQIIESQLIGLLTYTDRFILIGDEQQLPAICIQDEVFQETKSENLKAIEMNNLSGSLFSRLIKICTENSWDKAYGMLEKQARMHKEIQELPNILFYNNRLAVLNEDIQNEEKQFFSSVGSMAEKLNKSHTVFFSSFQEYSSKMNLSEVELITDIVNMILEDKGEEYASNIGIISPFRLQCSTIRKMLPEAVRAEILVDTVERFQGSQREVIILSLAVNQIYDLEKVVSHYQIGDNLIDRKLNVALTRASKQLIVTGNSEVLEYDPVYKKMVEYHRERGSFFEM